MSELCKNCKTPMEVAKNRNGGYFATCPNKANHGKQTAAAASQPTSMPLAPPTPASAPQRTVLGW